MAQVKRLKELETENARLRKAASDLTLDKMILAEATRGNFCRWADGSSVWLRAERANHVWPYDFFEDRTHEGRKYPMLKVVDEFTHECLAIRIDRKLSSTAIIEVLSLLFILRGAPGFVQSDNGPEFFAKAAQDWINAVCPKTAYITPGRP